MPDYWDIPPEVRNGVIHQTTIHVSTAPPRESLAAFRLLITASLQNLRYRQLDHSIGPPPEVPLATRAEYEAWCRNQPEYLAYLHDYQLFLKGYPPGEKLQYLDFEVRPYMEQSFRDPSKDKEPWRRYAMELPERYKSWDEVDLWPIPPEHRKLAVVKMLKLVTQKEDVKLSIGASRAIMQATSVNLRFRKVGDIPPPRKPWPKPDPRARWYWDFVFCDGQYDIFERDTYMRDNGYPPGETFRWPFAKQYITDQIVPWDRINHFLAINDIATGDDPPKPEPEKKEYYPTHATM